MAITLQQIQGYLNKVNYVEAIVTLIAFFVVAKLFVYISEKYVLHLTKKTKTEIDDVLVRRTNKPLSVLLFLIGLRVALVPAHLGIVFGIDIEGIAGRIVSSLIIASITYVIIVIVDVVIDHWGKEFAKKTKSDFDDNLVALFHKFSRVIMGIVGLLFILSTWGVKIGPLLASLGIAGVAVAFALQNSLSNIFGGISLILDRSIKVGDVITLDGNLTGTVMDVGLRSTKIKTFDNEYIIVPNGKLADSRIQNLVMMDPKLRVTVDFGVVYGSDVDKVKRIVLESISSVKKIMPEPKPDVGFVEMGDFALKFRLLFWVSNFDDKLPAKEKATCEVYSALNKAGIGIPFPTQTVYVKN